MSHPTAGRALVTGASRRVGRAIALELGRRGFEVTLMARTRSEDLLETMSMLDAECAARGGNQKHDVLALDLADSVALERFLDEHQSQRWDVLVLNASRYERTGLPLESALTPEAPEHVPTDPTQREQHTASQAVRFARDAEAHFRVNAGSALALAVGLAPSLSASMRPGGGAIVALGDMHVEGRPVRGFTPYLMSKAALGQMVRSLAVELAPRVRVNAVHPGVVAWPDGTDDSTRRAYEARIPLGRSGTPEDAASAVAWLALEAPYVTGVELRLDGGRWLR